MRGLNEVEALQRAWSQPDRSLSWVCDFIHDGRIRQPLPEPSQSRSVCEDSKSTDDTHNTEVVRRAPLVAWVIAWFVAKLCVVSARLLNRGGDNE